MSQRLITTLSALVLFAALICVSPKAQRVAASSDDLRERDEVNESYRLAPGASVDVQSISGSVTIETAETATADIHIVRSADTNAELACRPVKIEHTDASLRIDGQDDRRQCRNARVNQTVTLRLPRQIRLEVTSISGHVTTGDIVGSVRLTSISGHATIGNVRGPINVTSISGHVTVASALDEARFTSISGRVSINISRLGARGLKVESVSGSVDVGLGADVNADFRVESISGSVYADDARITINKVSDNEFNGRVGAGGAPLEFSSISGNIRLHRAGN